eukprot:m.309995 g.309995  ORF g.309995 m.309995 type:complete len:773 (-) comp19646_c0_seq7:3843-6161(-)
MQRHRQSLCLPSSKSQVLLRLFPCQRRKPPHSSTTQPSTDQAARLLAPCPPSDAPPQAQRAMPVDSARFHVENGAQPHDASARGGSHGRPRSDDGGGAQVAGTSSGSGSAGPPPVILTRVTLTRRDGKRRTLPNVVVSQGAPTKSLADAFGLSYEDQVSLELLRAPNRRLQLLQPNRWEAIDDALFVRHPALRRRDHVQLRLGPSRSIVVDASGFPDLSALCNCKDFYDLLGVGEDASQREIRSVYLSLMRRFHPDRDPPDGVTKLQQTLIASAIINAYTVLSDPERREQYNQQQHSQEVSGKGLFQFIRERWQSFRAKLVGMKVDGERHRLRWFLGMSFAVLAGLGALAGAAFTGGVAVLALLGVGGFLLAGGIGGARYALNHDSSRFSLSGLAACTALYGLFGGAAALGGAFVAPMLPAGLATGAVDGALFGFAFGAAENAIEFRNRSWMRIASTMLLYTSLGAVVSAAVGSIPGVTVLDAVGTGATPVIGGSVARGVTLLAREAFTSAGLSTQIEARPNTLRFALGPRGWTVSGVGSGLNPKLRMLADTTYTLFISTSKHVVQPISLVTGEGETLPMNGHWTASRNHHEFIAKIKVPMNLVGTEIRYFHPDAPVHVGCIEILDPLEIELNVRDDEWYISGMGCNPTLCLQTGKEYLFQHGTHQLKIYEHNPADWVGNTAPTELEEGVTPSDTWLQFAVPEDLAGRTLFYCCPHNKTCVGRICIENHLDLDSSDVQVVEELVATNVNYFAQTLSTHIQQHQAEPPRESSC